MKDPYRFFDLIIARKSKKPRNQPLGGKKMQNPNDGKLELLTDKNSALVLVD